MLALPQSLNSLQQSDSRDRDYNALLRVRVRVQPYNIYSTTCVITFPTNVFLTVRLLRSTAIWLCLVLIPAYSRSFSIANHGWAAFDMPRIVHVCI